LRLSFWSRSAAAPNVLGLLEVSVDKEDELAQLLNEARAGNRQALSVLLDRLRPEMRQRAQARLGNRLLARLDGSDIAQEIYLRAWQNFGDLQGDTVGHLLAWLEEIFKNVITDCRRRHGALKRDAAREVSGDDLFCGLMGDGTTPSQGAMRNEQQARMIEALQRLPSDQRQVFQLRVCEGLPFEEVARRIGVSEGNARVLLLRARNKLKSELGCNHEQRQ
jgi:RNA polymerase sigma-70 factor (ECF subfamily)